MTAAEGNKRLVKVFLDKDSIGPGNRDIEHERAIAIYDLVEENSFAPVGHDSGPYCLRLQLVGSRLIFDIRTEDDRPVVAHHLSLTPFRRLVKDYFLVCESYYQAIRTATPSQIEAEPPLQNCGRRSRRRPSYVRTAFATLGDANASRCSKQ
jgi:uncharacterized protein (UPF0262 family)